MIHTQTGKKRSGQTDWIIIKCNELRVDPEELYPDVMSTRRRIRQLNVEYERMIKEARTLQELEEIEQKIKETFTL